MKKPRDAFPKFTVNAGCTKCRKSWAGCGDNKPNTYLSEFEHTVRTSITTLMANADPDKYKSTRSIRFKEHLQEEDGTPSAEVAEWLPAALKANGYKPTDEQNKQPPGEEQHVAAVCRHVQDASRDLVSVDTRDQRIETDVPRSNLQGGQYANDGMGLYGFWRPRKGSSRAWTQPAPRPSGTSQDPLTASLAGRRCARLPRKQCGEAHVEVPLPDLDGRGQILKIHAEKMRQSGRLRLDDHDPFQDGCTLQAVDESTYSEWVSSVAEKTEGFSGASMAAVVRAAVARALSRSVEADDVFACAVTSSDFDDAVEDVRRSQMPVVLED